MFHTSVNNIFFLSAKMSYYSHPPAWIPSPHLSTEALAAVKQAFNFEELEEDNKSTLKGKATQPFCVGHVLQKSHASYFLDDS